MSNIFGNNNETGELSQTTQTQVSSAWDKKLFDGDDDHTPRYIKLDGEYDFIVKSLEKAYFKGSTAIPPCDMANLILTVKHPQGSIDVKTNIKICDMLASVVKNFFMSIDMRDEATGRYCTDWSRVVGCKGRALFGQSKPFTNRGGKEMTVNEVKRYLVPDKTDPAEDQKSSIGIGPDRNY